MADAELDIAAQLDCLALNSEGEIQIWSDALLAIDVFALALQHKSKFGSVGIRVKAQAGPVRDAWLEALTSKLPDLTCHRLPSGVAEDQLLGGLDLNATLIAGKSIVRRGILADADSGMLVIPMAEAMDDNISAQIALAMDDGKIRLERDGLSSEFPTRFGLVVLDESEPDEAGIAESLADRLMLHIDITKVSIRTSRINRNQTVPTEFGRLNLASLNSEQYEEICQMTLAFGLRSLRPSSQLLVVARCLGALRDSEAVEQIDIVDAVRLSLLGRATTVPQMPSDQQQEAEPEPAETADENKGSQPEQEQDSKDQSTAQADIETPPDEVLLDALAANLPAGLLEQLRATANLNKQKKTKGPVGRSGSLKKIVSRGRRLSSRRGELRNGNRLDLIATLRAAVPWQKSRRGEISVENDSAGRVRIRPSDFHIKRYKQKAGSTCLFVVDASGSTALNRLAETKGAVELLLSESYARRDHVGLVSFRGRDAEVLLSPTRSLVRAKRALSALPGGGGTPLASGLYTAFGLAEDERRHGRTVSIVVLTDGSANVDMAGKGGRPKALEDAFQVANCIQSEGFDVMLIDVGKQPSERASHLADAMKAAYIPMPFASSTSLSNAVRQQAG